jgi:hypothetical protein
MAPDLALLFIASAITSSASARVGLQVGEPMALTLQLPFGERLETHVAIGRSRSTRRENVLNLDLVYRLPEIFGAIDSDRELVFWFGAGGRLATLPESIEEIVPGLRMPIGVSYLETGSRIELFMEISPGVDLDDERRISLEGSIGIRAWLDR